MVVRCVNSFWLANAPSVTSARRTRPEMGASTLVYSRFRRACSRDAAAAAYSALARSSSAMACLCSRTLTAPLATREE